MDSNLFKTKSIEQLVGDVEHGSKALKRSLTAWDLTLLGIGAIIGTGIFVLTGTAAANQAGPAIMMSYFAAGLACAFAAGRYRDVVATAPGSKSLEHAYWRTRACNELAAQSFGRDPLQNRGARGGPDGIHGADKSKQHERQDKRR